MTWLKIDDGFCEHEKIENLSDRAFRLHLAALCLCARLLTDGRVSESNARKLAAGIRMGNVHRYVDELVNARLWSSHNKGGWRIKDYLDYNPSSIKVKEMRARNAGRQARYQQLHNAVSDGATNDAPSRTPVNTKNQDHKEPELRDVDGLKRIAALNDRIGKTL